MHTHTRAWRGHVNSSVDKSDVLECMNFVRVYSIAVIMSDEWILLMSTEHTIHEATHSHEVLSRYSALISERVSAICWNNEEKKIDTQRTNGAINAELARSLTHTQNEANNEKIYTWKMQLWHTAAWDMAVRIYLWISACAAVGITKCARITICFVEKLSKMFTQKKNSSSRANIEYLDGLLQLIEVNDFQFFFLRKFSGK